MWSDLISSGVNNLGRGAHRCDEFFGIRESSIPAIVPSSFLIVSYRNSLRYRAPSFRRAPPPYRRCPYIFEQYCADIASCNPFRLLRVRCCTWGMDRKADSGSESTIICFDTLLTFRRWSQPSIVCVKIPRRVDEKTASNSFQKDVLNFYLL